MSCSDKLALWQAVGLQGALLALLLDKPLRLASLTVGLIQASDDVKSVTEAVKRAVVSRLQQKAPLTTASTTPTDIPLQVQVSRAAFPYSKAVVEARLIAEHAAAAASSQTPVVPLETLSKSARKKLLRQNKASASGTSVNWILGWTNAKNQSVESIIGAYGKMQGYLPVDKRGKKGKQKRAQKRRYNGQVKEAAVQDLCDDTKYASRLSKFGLLELFRETWAQSQSQNRYDQLFLDPSYRAVKAQAHAYQATKELIIGADGPFKGWVRSSAAHDVNTGKQ
jgi:hypothetical protein